MTLWLGTRQDVGVSSSKDEAYLRGYFQAANRRPHAAVIAKFDAAERPHSHGSESVVENSMVLGAL